MLSESMQRFTLKPKLSLEISIIMTYSCSACTGTQSFKRPSVCAVLIALVSFCPVSFSAQTPRTFIFTLIWGRRPNTLNTYNDTAKRG